MRQPATIESLLNRNRPCGYLLELTAIFSSMRLDFFISVFLLLPLSPPPPSFPFLCNDLELDQFHIPEKTVCLASTTFYFPARFMYLIPLPIDFRQRFRPICNGFFLPARI